MRKWSMDVFNRYCQHLVKMYTFSVGSSEVWNFFVNLFVRHKQYRFSFEQVYAFSFEQRFKSTKIIIKPLTGLLLKFKFL